MFAEVILKRRLPSQFDTLIYEIKELSVAAGQSVIVPFGKSRVTGMVTGFAPKKPDFNVKQIFGVLECEILLQPWQIELAKWISDYYLCLLSKVIPLFLPKKAWHIAHLPKKRGEASGSHGTREHAHALTEPQKQAIAEIQKSPGGKFLIHGVTGSGKTEIYLRLAESVLEQGAQMLFLVPEIALTPQLIDFVQSHFPKTPLSVIHSKLTDRERDANWLSIFREETKIVIGSRSALFSPFKKLGLIVMDEEHEWTYKQEQIPRYHARKVAEKMAELTGATLVAGSATPSVETYFKTSEALWSKGRGFHGTSSGPVGPERVPPKEGGRVRTLAEGEASSCGKRSFPQNKSSASPRLLLELPHRISDTPLPQATIIDLREEIRKGNFSIFSDLLREKLATTLSQNKQAILFINRRGIAPATLCRDCGFVMRCQECQVAMVLHRLESGSILVCHHCGKRELPPSLCPACESHYIKSIGIGTERVEEEVQKLFSLARVCRADSDTISKKADYHRLYEKLKNHEIDVLVGTQMIAKGLDLPQVHLVGIVLADTSLHFPDFRAAERTFQLLTQVSGRAGRRKEQGEVVIQTYNPEHYTIRTASAHDYQAFYNQEIAVRKELEYPPFAKIIRLHFSHESADECRKEIANLEGKLAQEARLRYEQDDSLKISSCPALIPKLHGKYHFEIIVRGKEPEKILKPLLPLKEGWKIDVDPL